MAALEAGAYRLRHGVSTTSPQTRRFFFVKLTDSAQTALESLKSNKDRKGATLQFGEKDGLGGCIRLPNGDVFNFRLDEIPNNDGPQGSFECVQTVRKGELEHLSDIKHRITVQATEASFENTRQKMTMADELNKKQCAKKIETSTTGPNISHRSKVLKRPGDAAPSSANPPKRPRPEASASVASPVNSPFGRSSHPVTKGSSSSSQHVINAPFSASRLPQSTASQPPPSTNSRIPGSLSHSSSYPSLVSQETLSGPSNSTSSQLSTSSRSPAAQPTRPLRERLIQTLALKSFSRPDLINKLKKYGYKDEERGELDKLLSEVATSNTAGPVEMFDLQSGCYSQVELNWSLYSPADSLTAGKRLAQTDPRRPSGTTNHTSMSKAISASDLPFSSFSSTTTSSTNSRPGASSKASRNNVEMDRLQNEVANARVSLAHPSPGDDLSPPPPSNSSTCSTPSPPDHSKLKEIGNKSSNKTSSVPPPAPVINHLYNTSQDDQSAEQGERENFDVTVAARYRPIKTTEQRRQYKNEFYIEYNEYKELHGQMAAISDQFTTWEAQLRDASKGSSEYQRIAELMRNEYKRLKKDDEYTQKRNRWDQLFKKLTLIKQRIKAYDVQNKKV